MKQKPFLALALVMLLTLGACAGNTNSSSPVSSAADTEPSSTAAEVSEITSSAGNESSLDVVSETSTETSVADDNSSDGMDTSMSEDPSADEASPGVLIAYFGVMETDGVDAVSGASRVVVDGQLFGNVEFLAQAIQGAVGGELFEIKTVQEYPTIHSPLLDFAAEEKSVNARPELAAQVSNLDSYDTVFLGYPNWNADLPMPLYTFLENTDLSGKTIIPFCPHGGSGFSGTIGTIAQLQPEATVITDGYSVSRDNVAESASDVAAWAQGIMAAG